MTSGSEPGEPPLGPLVPAAVADEIVLASRMVSSLGLVEAFGHVSARVGDHVVVTPGSAIGDAAASDLVVVDLDGERVGGGDNAPLELPLHLRIYRHRPDVGAVVRTHPHALTVLTVMGRPVRPVHDLGAVVASPPPLLDDPALVSTDALGDAAAAALGDAAALLLRGNGALTVGAGIREATIRAIYLDETARILLDGLPLGQPTYLDPEVAAQLGAVLLHPKHVARTWDHFARRIAPQPALGT